MTEGIKKSLIVLAKKRVLNIVSLSQIFHLIIQLILITIINIKTCIRYI